VLWHQADHLRTAATPAAIEAFADITRRGCGARLSTRALRTVVGSADWQGQVGIVIDVDLARGLVRRILGCLSDAVRIDEAPIDTALAFRWPVPATVQALRGAPLSSEVLQ
jgi:hypothetical protein